MKLPVKITHIEWSGGACPYQIEGNTEDGDYFYLRYRGGRFRAGVAKDHVEFWNKWGTGDNPYNIIDIQYGHRLDGSCNEKEHRPLLEGKVIFPEGFKMETEHYSEEQHEDERES